MDAVPTVPIPAERDVVRSMLIPGRRIAMGSVPSCNSVLSLGIERNRVHCTLFLAENYAEYGV
jgi:hypothetical protein